MNDQHAERIIRLLEEIRDGQRVQLERQAEFLSQQRERLAGLGKITGQASSIEAGAERVLAKSASLVAGARVLVFVAVPCVVLLVAFLAWVLFAHIAR